MLLATICKLMISHNRKTFTSELCGFSIYLKAHHTIFWYCSLSTKGYHPPTCAIMGRKLGNQRFIHSDMQRLYQVINMLLNHSIQTWPDLTWFTHTNTDFWEQVVLQWICNSNFTYYSYVKWLSKKKFWNPYCGNIENYQKSRSYKQFRTNWSR